MIRAHVSLPAISSTCLMPVLAVFVLAVGARWHRLSTQPTKLRQAIVQAPRRRHGPNHGLKRELNPEQHQSLSLPMMDSQA